MNKPNTFEDPIIATYKTHEEAERAIKELNTSGFDIRKLSIVAKGYRTEEFPLGFYRAADRAKAWGSVAAFWGALWGMLVATLAFLWGPITFFTAPTTPFLPIFAGGIAGAALAGGIAALAALAVSWSKPAESILKYERRFSADSYLVIAHGGNSEIEQARSIMSRNQTTDTEALAAM